MTHVLGYQVIAQGLDVFYQRPDHATYEIQQVIEEIPESCVMYAKGKYTITVCYDHSQCPMWVVLYEVSQQRVFATRWSPLSPNVIEEDHDKVKRFVVKAWYRTEEAARNEVEVFAEKHNYNQWAKRA